MSAAAWPRPPDTARARQAPLLYPLFGIGANVGQTLSGKLLSLFSSTASRRLSYAQQLQAIMLVVLGFGALVLALHHHIVHRFDTNVHGSEPPVVVVPPPAAAPPPLPAPSANGAAASGVGAAPAPLPPPAEPAPGAGGAPKRKAKLSLREALVFLANSPQIRCLAVMALAQGLSSNLIDIAWKSHLHMLHPTPAAYSVRPGASPRAAPPRAALPGAAAVRARAGGPRARRAQAFMGDVAMWTGIVTGTLMFASPLLFERWKWEGVAGATPAFMLWTGLPFFAGCILYTLAHPGGGAGTVALRALVLAGALLQARPSCEIAAGAACGRRYERRVCDGPAPPDAWPAGRCLPRAPSSACSSPRRRWCTSGWMRRAAQRARPPSTWPARRPARASAASCSRCAARLRSSTALSASQCSGVCIGDVPMPGGKL